MQITRKVKDTLGIPNENLKDGMLTSEEVDSLMIKEASTTEFERSTEVPYSSIMDPKALERALDFRPYPVVMDPAHSIQPNRSFSNKLIFILMCISIVCGLSLGILTGITSHPNYTMYSQFSIVVTVFSIVSYGVLMLSIITIQIGYGIYNKLKFSLKRRDKL